MFHCRIFSLAAALGAVVAWSATGLADDPPAPKDEALEGLLNKLDEQAKSDASRPPGEVETKDKALDNLLEKLGETQDRPASDDRPKRQSGPRDESSPP